MIKFGRQKWAKLKRREGFQRIPFETKKNVEFGEFLEVKNTTVFPFSGVAGTSDE